MNITVKNLTDGKYYKRGPDGFVEISTHKKVTQKPITEITHKQVATPIPEPIPFHLSVKRMDMAEFCMQKDAFNEPSDCAVVITDIFYNDYYKKRPYFLNATYVCENLIDLYYFSRYVGVNVVSKTDEAIENENTILINPTPNYNKQKYKNVIYTTILRNMPDGICDAICTNTPKKIYIEPNESGFVLIPNDFMLMSNEYVYMPDQKRSQDDTFRIVFGHLMKTDLIRINHGMYDFIHPKYITRMKMFFQVDEYFGSYKLNNEFTHTTTTTAYNELYA